MDLYLDKLIKLQFELPESLHFQISVQKKMNIKVQEIVFVKFVLQMFSVCPMDDLARIQTIIHFVPYMN